MATAAPTWVASWPRNCPQRPSSPWRCRLSASWSARRMITILRYRSSSCCGLSPSAASGFSAMRSSSSYAPWRLRSSAAPSPPHCSGRLGCSRLAPRPPALFARKRDSPCGLVYSPARMAGLTEVIVHTDGASRGNPGPAAIGVVIQDPQGRVLLELGEALQRTTNNVAEYTAVIRALERARELGARRVRCLMDSQLVVRQLNGSYKVKHADMLPLYRRVLELVQVFDDVTFSHVPREMNAEADRLANSALDNRGAQERAEEPEAAIRGLIESITAKDWDGARALLADGFRYRRPAAGDLEQDRDGFLRWVQGTVPAWRIERASSSGAL